MDGAIVTVCLPLYSLGIYVTKIGKIKPPPVLSKTTILDACFADEMPEGQESFVSYKPKNNQWIPADDANAQTNFFEVKKAVERKHAAYWHGIILLFL